jgi:hypothetical protein
MRARGEFYLGPAPYPLGGLLVRDRPCLTIELFRAIIKARWEIV